MNSAVCLASYPPGTQIAEGGLPSLWDIVATAHFVLTNIGNTTAAEVAQLYVGIPGGPEKVLRGFVKETVSVGQSITIRIDLTRRDLSTWDVVAQSWLLQAGSYTFYVGASVLDIKLAVNLEVRQNMTC